MTRTRAKSTAYESIPCSYEVERIVKKRTKNGCNEYLLKWKHYPEYRISLLTFVEFINCFNRKLTLLQRFLQVRKHLGARGNIGMSRSDCRVWVKTKRKAGAIVCRYNLRLICIKEVQCLLIWMIVFFTLFYMFCTLLHLCDWEFAKNVF